MDSTVYLVGARMESLAQNLDIIAHNLANANTPGFKRTLGTFSATLSQLLAGESAEDGLTFSSLSERSLDFTPGEVRSTGRPLDVAIVGDGLLAVETADGERYTRKGRLYLSAAGELTDGAGHRVLGESGPLALPGEFSHLLIGPEGDLTADGQTVGRLKLVEIPDRQALVAEGAGLYRNDGPPARAARESRLVQGCIEESNVKPVHEMVALVEVSRAYEAAARIAKRLEALGRELVKDTA